MLLTVGWSKVVVTVISVWTELSPQQSSTVERVVVASCETSLARPAGEERRVSSCTY